MRSIRIASSVVLAACLLVPVAAADQERDDAALLTVRGEAVLDKPADQLRLQVGVVTDDPSASTAMAENSRRMQEVVEALHGAGLTEREYQTGQFSLQPQYSPRPRNAEPGWRPQIVGYRVTNQLTIRTGRIEMAGKLIEACSRAGANSIDSIGFDLADPRRHRREAIAAATSNARADAATLAEAAGQRLVRVRSISLDQADWRPPVMYSNARGAMAMAESMPPPIAPGDVTVRASVTIVYEIAPAE